jgi:chemotaxis protein histidine kinase CheA
VPALTPEIDVTAETKSKIANPSGAAAQSMRVDVRKLDELIGMIGELVLERTRLLPWRAENSAAC